MQQNKVAIDVGSNAIRMIVGHPHDGLLRIHGKYRMPVRLGKDVFEHGFISQATMDKAVEAFRRFKAVIDRDQLTEIKAIATSALREAKNKTEFCDTLFEKTGIRIQIISGDEEATLISCAIEKELDLKNKTCLLIDIGGGSVELTIKHDGQTMASQSFPLGTVRTLNELKKRGLQEKHLFVIIGEYLPTIINFLKPYLKSHSLQFCIGTGGNFECMRELRNMLVGGHQGSMVTLHQLVEISQVLMNLNYSERIKNLNLKPDRADVIIPALLLTKTIMRQAGTDQLIVPGVGLRDGILWSLFPEEK